MTIGTAPSEHLLSSNSLRQPLRLCAFAVAPQAFSKNERSSFCPVPGHHHSKRICTSAIQAKRKMKKLAAVAGILCLPVSMTQQPQPEEQTEGSPLCMR